MFEQESEEYGKNYNSRLERKLGFRDGATFGYKRCKEVSNKIIQSLLTIIYTESRTDIYTDEIGDAEKFLEEDYV